MNQERFSISLKLLLTFTITTSLFLPPTLHLISPAQAHETRQDYLQQTVFYNTKSYIYHKPDCINKKKCTKNCVPMKRADAQKHGRACKVCGG